MQTKGVLNMAHAVRCASKADDVSQHFSRRSNDFDTPPYPALYKYYLALDVRTFYVDGRRNLFYCLFRVIGGQC